MKFKTDMANDVYNELRIGLDVDMEVLIQDYTVSPLDLFMSQAIKAEKLASIAAHCAHIDSIYVGLKASITIAANQGDK